jgi:hypothetical protein
LAGSGEGKIETLLLFCQGGLKFPDPESRVD